MIVKNIRNLIVMALLLMFTTMPVLAATNTDNQLFKACDANSLTKDSPICKDRNTTTNPVNDKIKVAADIVALAAGAAAVILIIVSGFKFITAGGASPGQRSGDPNAIKSARATLTAAIIGLVIIALAWTIVTFVTDRFIQ